MKKIINLLFLAGLMVMSASCSDDPSNPYARNVQVEVTKSDVYLDAVASEGIIAYTAKGEVTVACDVDWCQAVVESESLVRVTAPQNNSRESRAALVVLRCNGDSVQVPVVQKGAAFVFSSDVISSKGDDAQRIALPISCSLPIQVASAPEWMNAAVNDTQDSLIIEMEANTTGFFRDGFVNIQSEDFVESIKVVQYDFDQDFAGNYTLYFEDNNGKQLKQDAVVTASSFELPKMKLKLEARFEPSTNGLVFHAGQRIGNSGVTYYYNIFWLTEKNIWTSYYGGAQAQFVFAKTEIDGGQTLEAHFYGYDSQYDYDMLDIHKFSEYRKDDGTMETEDIFCEAGDKGSLMKMYRPYLVKK